MVIDRTVNGRGAGRPTKRTAAVLEDLLGALERGMPQRAACAAVGVAVSTLSEWREADPGLEQQLIEAKERGRRKALGVVYAAAEKDWRAAAEFLKLTCSDYRNSTKIDVTASANFTGPVCSDDERQALMDRWKKLMQGESKTGAEGAG